MFYALSFTSWKYLNLLERITHLSVPDVAEVRQYYDVFDRHFVYVYGTWVSQSLFTWSAAVYTNNHFAARLWRSSENRQAATTTSRLSGRSTCSSPQALVVVTDWEQNSRHHQNVNNNSQVSAVVLNSHLTVHNAAVYWSVWSISRRPVRGLSIICRFIQAATRYKTFHHCMCLMLLHWLSLML